MKRMEKPLFAWFKVSAWTDDARTVASCEAETMQDAKGMVDEYLRWYPEAVRFEVADWRGVLVYFRDRRDRQAMRFMSRVKLAFRVLRYGQGAFS